MPVDSYKWLPPSLKGFYANMTVPPYDGVPWTPFAKPLREARIALVTTAGINVRGVEPPFDWERERQNPTWGDPSYRTLPRDLRQDQVQTGHLHINNDGLDRDVNVAFPVHRMLDLEAAGEIGSLADHNYSFMGYQPDTTEWRERYGPEVAQKLRDQRVDGVLLTPV
jgi:D-proline reductase (dithiol) PrdB